MSSSKLFAILGWLAVFSLTTAQADLMMITGKTGSIAGVQIDVLTNGSSTAVPTVASCGTSPVLNPGAKDNGLTVTPGTGASSCTVTFGGTYVNHLVGIPSAQNGTALAWTWAAPLPPASGYTASGPSAGTVGVVSSAFTVTGTPSGSPFNGLQTITVSDGGGSGGGALASSIGTSGTGTMATTPATGTMSFTFTYTPVTTGTFTLTTTNNQSWSNPPPLSYTSSPPAAAIGDPQVIATDAYVPAGYGLTFNSEFPAAAPLAGIANVGNDPWTPSQWWYHWGGTQCCMDFGAEGGTQTGGMFPTPSPVTGVTFPYTATPGGAGGVDLNLACPGCPTTNFFWTSAIPQSLAQCDNGFNCGLAPLSGTGGFAQQYGFFEMSAKLPSSGCTWPGFWMRPVNAGVNIGEIDIMEAYTQFTGGYCATATNWLANVSAQGCWGNPPTNATVPPPNTSTPGLDGVFTYPPIKTVSDGYHVYWLNWTPTTMTFGVDNAPQITTDITGASWNSGTAFDGPYYLMWDLGYGGGGQTCGPSGPPTSPQLMNVKYIRAYQRPGAYPALSLTVPSAGLLFNTATSTPLPGISLAATSATAPYAVTVTSGHGNFSASGAGGATVSGSGTATLTISGTLTEVNTALGTLAVTQPTSLVDTLVVNAHDSSTPIVNASAQSLSMASYGTTSAYVPSGYTLTFNDEFTSLSTIDRSGTVGGINFTSGIKWYNGLQPASCCMYPTGANDVGTLFPTPIVATGTALSPFSLNADGSLNFTTTATPNSPSPTIQWNSAVMQTIAKDNLGFSQQYGYFETMVKMPASPGGNGSFPVWSMLPLNPGANNGEIDIYQYSPTPSINALCTYIHDYANSVYAYSGCNALPNVANLQNSYHIIGMLWTSSALTFYVDGVAYWTVPPYAVAMGGPYFMVQSLGLGGGWPAGTGTTTSPTTLNVRYIRAYH